jgi:hypothetical protein
VDFCISMVTFTLLDFSLAARRRNCYIFHAFLEHYLGRF